jgi:hypothetical protein
MAAFSCSDGAGKEGGKTFESCDAFTSLRNLMAIGAEQAAIGTVIAGAIVDNVGESGRGIDALLAIRQAEAIVRALELVGYEITRRT